MTGKHASWRKRWAVDLTARRAAHACGLVVEFTPAADTPGAHDGSVVSDAAVLDALLRQHGPHNIGPHVSRLMREAGQVYSEALDRDRRRTDR